MHASNGINRYFTGLGDPIVKFDGFSEGRLDKPQIQKWFGPEQVRECERKIADDKEIQFEIVLDLFQDQRKNQDSKKYEYQNINNHNFQCSLITESTSHGFEQWPTIRDLKLKYVDNLPFERFEDFLFVPSTVKASFFQRRDD